MTRPSRGLSWILVALVLPSTAAAIGPRLQTGRATMARLVRAPRRLLRAARPSTSTSQRESRGWTVPVRAEDLTATHYTRIGPATARGAIDFGHGAVPALDALQVDAPLTAVQRQDFQRTRYRHGQRDLGAYSQTRYDTHGDPVESITADLGHADFVATARGTYARGVDGVLTTTNLTVTHRGTASVDYTADLQGRYRDPKNIVVPTEQVVPPTASGPVLRRVVTRVHRLPDGRLLHHDTVYNRNEQGEYVPIETSVAVGRPDDPRVRPSVGHTLLDAHGRPLNTVWVDHGASTGARTIRAVLHARDGQPERSFTFEADQRWHNEQDARDVRDTVAVFGEMTWGAVPSTKTERLQADAIGVGRRLAPLPPGRARTLFRAVNLRNFEAGDKTAPSHTNCIATSMTTFSALALDTELAAVLGSVSV